ncbi:MAG: hypothetical protein ABJF23_13355 [Bryobacteraceae bacterium]
MSTPAQVTANLLNSRNSTGPITDEGKQNAAANSIKHGLTSKRIIIPAEDPTAFDELRANMHADWKPATHQETALVDQIAQQAWRLERARRIETASFEAFMPNLQASPKAGKGGRVEMLPTDPDEASAAAFHGNAKAFDNLRRYEAAIERSYYRAITELRKLQTERCRQPQPESIGFVSQKPLTFTHQPAPNPIKPPMLKSDIPWKTTSSGNKPYLTPFTPASS